MTARTEGAASRRPWGRAPGGAPPADPPHLAHLAALARRADEDLVEQAVADPQGPHQAELKARLGEYGFKVLTGWARHGELRTRAARAMNGAGVLGIERVPFELDESPDEAEMVVVDMLEMALRNFWGRPLRTWEPTGGSRVTTYFVTYCFMQLPGAYDKFFRREVRPLLMCASAEPDDDLFTDPDEGPEAIAELREQVAKLAKGDRRLLRILLLRVAGCTLREIAERLSEDGPHTTEGQVRGALHKVARDARELRRRRDDPS